MDKKTGIAVGVVLLVLMVGVVYALNASRSSSAPNINTTATANDSIDTTGTITTTQSTTTTTVDTGAVKSFTVSGKNFSFAPASISVKKGDTVKITFKNSGGFHDLRVEGYNVGTKQIASGQEETFQFVADKAGTFEYYCSVGNHRAMGMKGTLTVQ
jgi:plastocyanin